MLKALLEYESPRLVNNVQVGISFLIIGFRVSVFGLVARRLISCCVFDLGISGLAFLLRKLANLGSIFGHTA